MVTKQQLLDAAAAKKAEFLITIDEYTSKEYISIRLKDKYVYYHFTRLPWEEYVSFDHSYSQNTGRTSKSYRTGWTILRNLKLMD